LNNPEHERILAYRIISEGDVMRMSMGIVLLVLAPGLAGCGSFSAPSAPSPVPQATNPPIPNPPIPASLVMFTDSVTGFSTSDVRDAQEQIVRFNTAGELIWTADDTRFRLFRVSGNLIWGLGRDDWFQVSFGTKNGERRAYFGQSDDYCHCPGYPATVADIEVVGGQLVITWPGVLVPGT
jgi:hypothetical protein